MPDLFETGDVDLKKLLNAEDKELIARIKSILGPFILRRLKSDVMKQLVPKIQTVCILFIPCFLFSFMVAFPSLVYSYLDFAIHGFACNHYSFYIFDSVYERKYLSAAGSLCRHGETARRCI